MTWSGITERRRNGHQRKSDALHEKNNAEKEGTIPRRREPLKEKEVGQRKSMTTYISIRVWGEQKFKAVTNGRKRAAGKRGDTKPKLGKTKEAGRGHAGG